ncbi:ubiquinol--cytochrome-c reductase subunit 8 [Talaromyces marneffei ATCC 18224]
MVTHADPKNGYYAGRFGALVIPSTNARPTRPAYPITFSPDGRCPTPQRGIAAYSISPNRQDPLAGTFNAAIFNTFRRFRHQVLYFAPPFIVAYAAMNWAVEKNEYLNSKPGRFADGGEE